MSQRRLTHMGMSQNCNTTLIILLFFLVLLCAIIEMYKWMIVLRRRYFMSIEKDLKKDGIQVIKEVDTLSVTLIAKFVAERLSSTFLFYGLKYNDLFIKISRIPMYIATMPDGMAEANYFYKNSSIYFKAGVSIDKLEKFAMHEFIHYLQEIKDKKGNLVRLGLCDFAEIKVQGMALNEGAVQLMAAKALNQPQDIVKYYGISLPTNSPDYYPILCNLVAQMAYVVGEESLFDSTFYGSSIFKERFVDLCGLNPFLKIQNNLDKIMNIEENIIKLNNKLLSDNCEGMKAQRVASKITKCKQKLQDLYFETQNMIFSSYFDKQFHAINTTADIDFYRFRLYNYKNFIGITDNYTAFNDYYIQKMMDLDIKYESIINNTSLVVSNQSAFAKFFRKLRALLGMHTESEK